MSTTKKKGFIRDNLSEKLHYFPKSIILIDTRQKNLLILMISASINIKYSSAIGTTAFTCSKTILRKPERLKFIGLRIPKVISKGF